MDTKIHSVRDDLFMEHFETSHIQNCDPFMDINFNYNQTFCFLTVFTNRSNMRQPTWSIFHSKQDGLFNKKLTLMINLPSVPSIW